MTCSRPQPNSQFVQVSKGHSRHLHTISLRIHLNVWRNSALFADMLDMLSEYREAITEVAFFTSHTHAPLPLATIKDEAEQLGSESLPAVRALGIRAGINHLSTLGHLDDENPENSLREPWQHLVDMSGAVSTSCYCAADPCVLDYIRRCYAALATAGPDFIWIDDDVRLEHHPPAVRFACFCPHCLENFTRESERPWTREALCEHFNSGSREERLSWRRQWQEHNNRYLTNLCREIRDAVDAVNPTVSLGMMSGEIAYSTYNFASWAKALAGPHEQEVKWRPGGGVYTDEMPLGALYKAHSIGRQVACLPPNVRDIQYELENFPYQNLRKSTTIFAAEIAAAIGAGCTGVALNCIAMNDSPWESQPYFAKIRDMAMFYATAADTFGRSTCEGIYTPYEPLHVSVSNIDGAWGDTAVWGTYFTRYAPLSEIGLPFAHAKEGASITLLTPESCVEYSPDELRALLATAVMLDGETLACLDALGLADLTGFRVSGRKDQNSIERLTAHALNGKYAGTHRDCRPSFYAEPVHLFEPTMPGAETLSEVIDFSNVVHGAGAGVYENALGGRVAVFGYYPWNMIHNTAKTTQLKAVCRWLTQDRLPAYIATSQKVALWCRRDASGKPALLLLNISADAADAVEIHLLGTEAPLQLIQMDGTSTTLLPTDVTFAYTAYRVAYIAPWQAVILRHE